MRIAINWFFDTRINSSGPTISKSIEWCFICGQCQASPQIPSMPTSITYKCKLARSTEIKTNLDARVPTVAISFRAGPKMWAGARPPSEKVPLELVPYCWCKHPVTPPQAHGLGPHPTTVWPVEKCAVRFGEKSCVLEEKVVNFGEKSSIYISCRGLKEAPDLQLSRS